MEVSERMYQKIAVSNRHLFMSANGMDDFALGRQAFINQIEKITRVTDFFILREKDLNPKEYESLASEVLRSCNKNRAEILLHSFYSVAEQLNYKKIHLPLPIYLEQADRWRNYDYVGVSVHSLEEAKLVEKMGADYITFSHIFQTDCKATLKPKGLEALAEVCRAVKIPVFALGGIDDTNEYSTIEAGAQGACRMSFYMKM